MAKFVRRDALNQPKWNFEGNYKGFDTPSSLETLIKWIIIGMKHTIDKSPRKAESVDVNVQTICELILKSVKTERQISHVTNEDFRNTHVAETPLTVGLGLHIHHKTRSKHIIDTLSQLNLTIAYKRILQIETEIANAVYECMQQNGGVYVPSTLVFGIPVHFAIDNTDIKNDTPDGKNEFYGTGIVVFQKRQEMYQTSVNICNSSAENIIPEDLFVPNETIHKPNPPNERFPDFSGIF